MSEARMCPNCGAMTAIPTVFSERWRPIETAPTEPDKRLLVYAGGEVVIGYRNDFYEGNPWWQCEDEGPLCWGRIEPTHWMPLPDPPEQNVGMKTSPQKVKTTKGK